MSEKNVLTEFDKYLYDTCATINKKIMEIYPEGADGSVFQWAKKNEGELFLQEEQSYSRIDEAWHNANDFEGFKKTVLEWGRVVLKIYKKFSESPHVFDSAGISGGQDKAVKSQQMSFG